MLSIEGVPDSHTTEYVAPVVLINGVSAFWTGYTYNMTHLRYSGNSEYQLNMTFRSTSLPNFNTNVVSHKNPVSYKVHSIIKNL